MTAPDRLHVSCDVSAPPARVFDAWTSPDEIVQWWGGGGITCPEAEIDLRRGGGYRIANMAPDGATTWISGVFELIDPPHRLTYTWSVEPVDQDAVPSLVEVEFSPIDGGTRVTVSQSRIPSQEARQMFLAGWTGCLAGLEALLGR